MRAIGIIITQNSPLTAVFVAAAIALAGPALMGTASAAHAQAALDDNASVRSAPKPAYPKRAARRGVQGCVTVQYEILASGEVANVKILESEPSGVFEDSVLEAVSGWKFSPQAQNFTKQTRITFQVE